MRAETASGATERPVMIPATEECQSCFGAGQLRDSDTNVLRKCLDCRGDGLVHVKLPPYALRVAKIHPGDKDIDIDSVDDDGYHAVRIKLSRDDCNTTYAEGFAEFLVRACNSHVALMQACQLGLKVLEASGPLMKVGATGQVMEHMRKALTEGADK